MAFHIGPRFIIAAVHRSYHMNLVNTTSKHQELAKWWLNLAFWLNVIEIGSLCGVTYISNRENYRKYSLDILSKLWTDYAFVAIHEKLFITFMISSLAHMLACIKGIRWVAETNNDVKVVQNGLLIKQGLLVISVLSTIGLVGFFLEHRLLCHDMGKFSLVWVYV